MVIKQFNGGKVLVNFTGVRKRMMRQKIAQRGVSLIAAIFIIVILAFMGTMFVSLVNTANLTSVNDLQSTQALYVAEGGTEYAVQNFAFPNYSTGGATVNLGAGHFNVATPAYLTADPGTIFPISVNSTANFPATGRIIIDSELVDYTGKNATQFTAGTRGVGGTTAVAHPTANAAVYPVTSLTDNPLLIGSTTINVTSNVGFSIPGVLIIDTEYIFCSGINGTTQFTNCARHYNGSTETQHDNLSNVFQYVFTSTGTVASGERVVERSAIQVPGAMMVYAKANGDPVPYYRRWNGISWGPELQANSVGAGRTIQYMVIKFARTRNEAVLATLDSTGSVQAQTWNGAAWSAPTVIGTASTSSYRCFDMEYETNNDRAIIVYNYATNNRAAYRIWDGVTWSAAQNFPLGTAIGALNWVEMSANPGNNEIALIVLGSNADVYGTIWTGAGWNNTGGTWDTAVATATQKIIDVAYEQVSHRVMFIWGDASATRRVRYRIWDGATSTLSGITNLTLNQMTNNAGWVRLAPDPYSNYLILGVQDQNSRLVTDIWTGAAWVGQVLQDTGTENAADRNFDVVYETSSSHSGRAWLVWGDGATVSRRYWDGPPVNGWSAVSTTGDDTALVQLLAHPISGVVFSVMYESTASATDDIWESHLTSGGATWSPRFAVWLGPTVASPVMEKCAIAAERRNPSLTVQGWREVFK